MCAFCRTFTLLTFQQHHISVICDLALCFSASRGHRPPRAVTSAPSGSYVGPQGFERWEAVAGTGAGEESPEGESCAPALLSET